MFLKTILFIEIKYALIHTLKKYHLKSIEINYNYSYYLNITIITNVLKIEQ